MDDELIIKNNELIKYTNCDDDTAEFAYKIIKIPEGITKICEDAFSGASDVRGVVIPSTVKTIAKHAFYNCLDLEVVLIKDGVETIEDVAFDNCSNLTSLYIPQSVTSIGKGAFMACEKLEQLIIPNGTFELQSYSFMFCSGLKRVYLSSSVEFIVSDAFADCNEPQFMSEEDTAAHWYAEENGLVFQEISQLEIDALHAALYETCKEKTSSRVLYDEFDACYADDDFMELVKKYAEA